MTWLDISDKFWLGIAGIFAILCLTGFALFVWGAWCAWKHEKGD